MPSINSNPSSQDLLLAWAARPSSSSPQEAYAKRKARYRFIKFLNNTGMLASRGVRYLFKINFVTFSNQLNNRLQNSSLSAAERSQLRDAYEKLAQKKWKIVKKDRACSKSKFHVGAYQAYKAVMGIVDPQPRPQPPESKPINPVVPPANSDPLLSGSVPNPPVVTPPKHKPAPAPAPVIPAPLPHKPFPPAVVPLFVVPAPVPAPVVPPPKPTPAPAVDPFFATPSPQSILSEFEGKIDGFLIDALKGKIDSVDQLSQHIKAFREKIEIEYERYAKKSPDLRSKLKGIQVYRQTLLLFSLVNQFKSADLSFRDPLYEYTSFILKRISGSAATPVSNGQQIIDALKATLGLLQNPQAHPAPQYRPAEPDKAELLPDDEFESGPRTVVMGGFLQGIEAYNRTTNTIDFGGVSYTPVTAKTKGISTKCVASCGSSPTREILLLDPNKSPLLNQHYINFKYFLSTKGAKTVEQVLNLSKEYIRKEVFPLSGNPSLEAMTDVFVQQEAENFPDLRTKSIKYNKMVPLIPIDRFIVNRIGVCRHLALVSLYFLDRLASEKDSPLYGGQAITIRDNLEDVTGKVIGAHVWVAFRKDDQRFHLDPMWNEMGDLTVPASVNRLKGLYGTRVITDEIKRLK